ncbi:twin transmembrane helix small protein [Paracoccaceae bacterium GXU_MW_L88]
MQGILYFLIVMLAIATAAVVIRGIIGFARGGEWNKKNSNNMMQWRILLQFLALIAIMAFLALAG